jgi:ubiquinone/menaquinone biosynthesis C-methylase UbiE
MESTKQKLLQMITGYWVSQAIFVAAKLGIADLVKDEPKTADELAKATGTHAPSLYRLLRGLASVEIFAIDDVDRFGLTDMARCLVDGPMSQRSVALMLGDEHYGAWSELLYSVQTGKPGFDKLYGKPVFDWYGEHPEQAKIFDAAMTGFHGEETQKTIDAYDFSQFKTVVDIGGGNGSVMIPVLQRNPNVRGILFDLASVIERSKPALERAGVADRCQAVAGDFFKSVVAGGDAYMMRHIIHDWTDEQCTTILKNIRQVIPPSGQLLVVEIVIPPGNEPNFGKFLDLNMLVIPGGRERTEEEYATLFAGAGFKLERIVPTKSAVSIIIGKPA